MSKTSTNKNLMNNKSIQLKGLRQNNLKNFDLDIPLRSFCVVCGPSGSGKSSLAFETLYAEGQRRFIDSLSNYSKQFLNKAPKPLLDSIENVPPALALEQKNTVRNSRSTVGTLSETIDLLRLLFEKTGEVVCPTHKTVLQKYSPFSATEYLLKNHQKERGYLIVTIKKSDRAIEGKELLAELLKQGYQRFSKKLTSGRLETFDLNDPALIKKGLPKKDFYLVIDRLAIKNEDKGRILDSVSQAFKASLFFHKELSLGLCSYFSVDGEQKTFSEKRKCTQCDYSFPDFTSHAFNFNNPVGACETCNGFGNILSLDPKKIIPNPNLSLAQGTIKPFAMPSAKAELRKLKTFCKEQKINLHTPWSMLDEKTQKMIWSGKGSYKGIEGMFKRLETKKYKMHVRIFLNRFKSPVTCTACNGSRIKANHLNIFVNQKNFLDFCNLPLNLLFEELNQLKLSPEKLELSKELLQQFKDKVQFLLNVGVGYLTLARETKTLSGGEFQRINLSNQLGLSLSQTLYVLDEPTIGLHPRDNDRLIQSLKKLNEMGNTLVVVEHDHDVILNSNHIIEMGPESGLYGGEVLFSGTQSEFFKNKKSPTLPYLKQKNWKPIRQQQETDIKKFKFLIELKGCSGNNLKNVDLKIPLNRFVTITGVSGSGKSSLISQTLYPALAFQLDVDHQPSLPFDSLNGSEHLKNVLLIDQSSVGKTTRSNPASYMKVFDPIRTIFSRTKEAIARGYRPGHFSLNVEGGRCPTCKGLGYEEVDMVFMDNIQITCEDCQGKRYRKETLEIKYQGKSILDVLNMTVHEAYQFFVEYSSIRKPLSLLKDVGLDYLTLGQSSSGLSGGESQRLKVAKALSNSLQKGTLFIFDEPSTGLHFKEIHLLIQVLDKLISSGASVLVVEHNQEIIANSDYIIDIGPEAGSQGGEIMAQGSPDVFLKQKSLTAQYLKKYIKRK